MKFARRAAKATQCLAGLLAFTLSASGMTWGVSVDGLGDAPTIQAAIDSSASGDTVLVYPGLYPEAIDFSGKNILVRGVMGAEQTTLDASSLGDTAVVTFQSNESHQAQLQGFTITGGRQGIHIHECEPTIFQNIVTGNEGARSGAGIWCLATSLGGPWSPIIRENIVTKNVAANISGGIGTWMRMTAQILDNYVAQNQAIAGDGGGIYYRGWDPGGVVRGNVVIGNIAGDHGGGIYAGSGLYGTEFEFELSWNLIAQNTANGTEGTGDSGGGLWLWETNAWVHHNTIVENAGFGSGVENGGGLVIGKPGSPVIEKNIIAFATAGGGIWCRSDATPVIRNNLAWENLGGDGVGDCPTWWQSNGNIVTDPFFCDPESGDYSLAQNSPALTHPAGPLGAFHLPGCGPVSVTRTTWGRIKTLYGSGN